LVDFDYTFRRLTSNEPFPWQRALYDRFVNADFPDACNLPTGLGKTNTIAVWLIAWLNEPTKIPRRFVYVVNRRTVVDQTTFEVENIRTNLCTLETVPAVRRTLAISTLRGQFADNREWSADPSRPAVICGTVDMIGSRLLFSGYNVGFRGRPLHAGFLGQDALLVHDEAHLEPAFQELIETIEKEQHERERAEALPWPRLRVMALTATPRGGVRVLNLTVSEASPPQSLPNPSEPIHHVWHRLCAQKTLQLESVPRSLVAKAIGEKARDRWKASGMAILVFVRTIEDVNTIHAIVTDKKHGVPEDQVLLLTGTLRGLERDQMVGKDLFRRFQLKAAPDGKTVYLICTSAGEVGVDISADHMVCDLTTLDSIVQRLGRVNRRGGKWSDSVWIRAQAEIDLICEEDPDPKQKDKPFEKARWKTLEILKRLRKAEDESCYDASPAALFDLRLSDVDRTAAFAPSPIILPATDILFDAWAMTTIRDKLPGRPPVEPYLHGLSSELPETQVAWRDEVGLIVDSLLEANSPKDLLEDYPLKPHELLHDRSDRVFDRLKSLQAPDETPLWIRDDDGAIDTRTLGWLRAQDKSVLNYRTVLLPPSAGGLSNGMLAPDSLVADDVADQWLDDQGQQRRRRLFDAEPTEGDYRLIRTIDTIPDADESNVEAERRRFWHWFELREEGDSDGSKSNCMPVLYDVHICDVVKGTREIVENLNLPDELRGAVVLAAKFHDLGKRRSLFQMILGNRDQTRLLAKSGNKGGFVGEDYRHEVGSLVDVLLRRNLAPSEEEEFKSLRSELQDLLLHLIAAHHGYARPHFPADLAFDPEHGDTDAIAAEVPQRFARLQRKYGRWGLACLESLLRAADWHASAHPSTEVET